MADEKGKGNYYGILGLHKVKGLGFGVGVGVGVASDHIEVISGSGMPLQLSCSCYLGLSIIYENTKCHSTTTQSNLNLGIMVSPLTRWRSQRHRIRSFKKQFTELLQI